MRAEAEAFLRAIAGPVGIIAVVLAGGFALTLVISSDPVLAYRDLLFTNFYSRSNFALFVNRTMPLLLTSPRLVLMP